MSATDAERLVQIAALAAAEHCCTVTPDATMADLAAYVHDHTMGYLLTAWLASPSAAVREAAEVLDEAVGSRATREALHAALCRTMPLPNGRRPDAAHHATQTAKRLDAQTAKRLGV